MLSYSLLTTALQSWSVFRNLSKFAKTKTGQNEINLEPIFQQKKFFFLPKTEKMNIIFKFRIFKLV